MIVLFQLLIVTITIILLFIAKEDFQRRTIHIGWLIALGIFGSIYSWQLMIPKMSWFSLGINIIFMILQFFLLSLYFSIKNRQWINIADTLLGWGDIVLFFILCLILPTLQLIWFYTISLMIVLVGFLIYKIIKNPSEETIPLAGGVSLCLVLYILYLEGSRFI